jgi:glutathione transport system permease protein
VTGYILRKLLTLPAVVLAVSLLIFLAVRMLPGDPARLIAGPEASSEAVAAIHDQLGLGRPVGAQYLAFLVQAARGDLGTSIESRRPVTLELAAHVPFTLALGLAAYALAVGLGVPGGILAAAAPGKRWDQVFSAATILTVSLPSFWVGLMAMELLAVRLQWLPLMGAGSPAHIVLPALTLSLAPMGLIGRMTRASMIEILGQDYIRTARAKGLAPFAIYARHALRNALPPIVTIVGLNLGAVIGGAVVTESVFSWPGVGRLLVDAVKYRDYPVIQGVTLAAVVAVVIANLSAEVAIAALDPRMRRAAP